MNPWVIALIALTAFLIGLILGVYYGAKLGIRIFAKDAIVLAFRSLDANPAKFHALRQEALKHLDFEPLIQEAIEGATRPKRWTIKDELAQDADYQAALKAQRENGHGQR